MKLTTAQKLYSGLATGVTIVIIVGCLSYASFRSQMNEAEWVDHTHEVLQTSAKIRQLITEMETGRRAFRSTGDSLLLEVYDSAHAEIQPVLRHLEKLVADNRTQTSKATAISKGLYSLITYWGSLNQPTTSLSPNRIRGIVYTEKRYMDQLKQFLDEFDKKEAQLLVNRKAETKQSAQLAIRTLLAGLALILIIVSILSYYVYRELVNRISVQRTLRNNLKEMEAMNADMNEKNWQLTGLSQISNQLQGHFTASGLAASCIENICKYLNYPSGIFYCYNAEAFELQPIGSYAPPAGDLPSFKIGEELPGQAARRQEVQVIDSVPIGFRKPASGMGQCAVVHLIYVPLWLDDDLKGLLELVSYQPIASQHNGLLTLVSHNVAIALHKVTTRERMEELFIRVREQKEELETQQEELLASNDQIRRQAERLLLSEEELKQREERLRNVNVELSAQNEQLENARQTLAQQTEELQASSRYKSEFLANMSHELRTPLNSILILAKLLFENKSKNLTAKQQEYCKIIHKSGSDLLDLINDILDLSKIEAGKIDMYPEDVQIKEILTDMEALFRVISEERKIDFNVSTGDNVPGTLRTDKQRVEQILKNLLSNAFKFTPQGGRVSLRVSTTKNDNQDMVCLTVSDTGVGIPHDKQQAIFEAFQQGDGATNRKFGGTGLGLSISKELTWKLGGTLSLQSEPGAGSIFFLFLPLTGPPGQMSEPAETERPEKIAMMPETGIPALVREQHSVEDDRKAIDPADKTVLIVEDDEQFATILRDVARQKGYKTIVALAGDEGLFCARKYKPTAIILDIYLPILSGKQLLSTLKRTAELADIPVHVISSNENAGEDVHEDVTGYTLKPMQFEELDAIFDLLDKEQNQPVSVVSDTQAKNPETVHEETQPMPVKGTAPVSKDHNFADKHILLADDDMRNVFAISALLESSGATVITAVNGREALEKLDAYPETDLVLMDIMMPEIDGYESIGRIREQERWKQLPIIALTAKAMIGDREKVIEAGASDYVSKPIDNQLLLSVIDKWLTT